jgi:hypothetical protein
MVLCVGNTDSLPSLSLIGLKLGTERQRRESGRESSSETHHITFYGRTGGIREISRL